MNKEGAFRSFGPQSLAPTQSAVAKVLSHALASVSASGGGALSLDILAVTLRVVEALLNDNLG